ncbi:unknown [Bacteroides sp. CAG:702]|nr:unknown [Bacteroides sp. CAG:702]
MDITLVLIILIFMLDCFVVYNIMHSNCTKKERFLYSSIVVLLPIIGIPIYYELREYNSKNNGRTSILNRIIDVILILITLWIVLSMIVNQLSTDSILGRSAVIIALIYNLSIFSKRKKTKLILLLAAVLLLVIATIIKIRLT